ncbi:CotG/ExsB N-terminal domain-containing protein [Neobacillus ginsengisoli]|uniref:Uncharacterized protein n=1 Tax=Neobacillus ginsengisoli TaxID=904295 RepID=A0ABT9XXM1_9BACI|nr:hypothetical protein [Neobacillus ginsengisoli]MDQ0200231.1 hypothetical protein [Neobacillus ginsengisoli]
MDFYSPAKIKEAVRGAESLGLSYFIDQDPIGGQCSRRLSSQGSSRKKRD